MTLIARYVNYNELSEEEKMESIHLMIEKANSYILKLSQSIISNYMEDFLQDINYVLVKIFSKSNKKEFDCEEQLIRYFKVCIENIHIKYIKDRKEKYNSIILYDDELYYPSYHYSFNENGLFLFIIDMLDRVDENEKIIIKSFINNDKLLSQQEVAKLLHTSQQYISYKLKKIKKKLFDNEKDK